MAKFNHPNIGNVLKHVYLTATVTEVDGANDTVNFTGIDPCPNAENIPLFYHCEPDSALRDNGALEGASGAFAIGDEVIVMCEIESAEHYIPLKVIGFTDKAKACCWEPFVGPDVDSARPWIEYTYVPSYAEGSAENSIIEDGLCQESIAIVGDHTYPLYGYFSEAYAEVAIGGYDLNTPVSFYGKTSFRFKFDIQTLEQSNPDNPFVDYNSQLWLNYPYGGDQWGCGIFLCAVPWTDFSTWIGNPGYTAWTSSDGQLTGTKYQDDDETYYYIDVQAKDKEEIFVNLADFPETIGQNISGIGLYTGVTLRQVNWADPPESISAKIIWNYLC